MLTEKVNIMKTVNPKIEPHLITRELTPENQETPIHFLRQWVTPTEYFFIRNHFAYPQLTHQSLFLHIEGEVIRPVVFKHEDIIRMPSRTLILPLE